MADELQSLIDRIQREGIAKAEQEAATLVASAKEKAADIVKTAEAQAQQLLQKAEREAEVFTARSAVTLTHAARDVLIDIGRSLASLFDSVIRRQVDAAMTPETLGEMLARMAEAYAAHGLKENRLAVLLSPDDRKALARLIDTGAAAALKDGVTLRADDGIAGGFRLSLRDGQVEHDFTAASVADAIGALVKPELAELAHRAARELTAESK